MAVLLAEVTLSLFAVFGLYAAVRLLFVCTARSKETVTALRLCCPVSKREAEWLLWRAGECTVYPRAVVVLVDKSVTLPPETVAYFAAYGIPCYTVEL